MIRPTFQMAVDDNVYWKYYDAVYILFHTGMRILEFCGLTLADIDLEKKIVNIDHQLLRKSNSVKYIQTTKTNAGTRKLPIKEDVAECFHRIIEGRPRVGFEKMVEIAEAVGVKYEQAFILPDGSKINIGGK